MSDPIEPRPLRPLIDSYSYHSPLPDWLLLELDKDRSDNEQGWMLGIDEAGRGPVLGPMVYAAAYCPISFKPTLESLGFDDSKALSPETRDALWNAYSVHPSLVYSSRTLSPQDISSGMLRRVPVNLNRQAEEATIGLIRDALARGVNLKEVYVDALGPAAQWQSRLSQIFPHLSIVVEAKADSTYKIVGAASIVAKVTRDRWIEMWKHPEGKGVERDELMVPLHVDEDLGEGSSGKGKGKGKGKGRTGRGKKVKGKQVQVDDDEDDVGVDDDVRTPAGTDVSDEDEDDDGPSRPRKRVRLGARGSRTLGRGGDETTTSGLLGSQADADVDVDNEAEAEPKMREALGSGYPSDPKTQTYLRSAFSPIFGYPSVVRFSWAGPKLRLEKDGVGCTWVDDGDSGRGGGGQKKLNFGNKSGRAGHDRGPGGVRSAVPGDWVARGKMCRDLGLGEVGQL